MLPCPNEDQASTPEICSESEDPHGPFEVKRNGNSFNCLRVVCRVQLEGFIKEDGTSNGNSEVTHKEDYRGDEQPELSIPKYPSSPQDDRIT